MLSVFPVLYIVAAISYFVCVARSRSVDFIKFLLPLVASFSVFARSLLYD